MSYRGWLLAAVLLAAGGPLVAEGEFPIGAWFPGIPHTEDDEAAEDAEWATRLDSVKAHGFNTIHARQGKGELRYSRYNQRWMAKAHERGLKVQLGSWKQPTKWHSFSRNYWTRVFEAEDMYRFAYPIGREATDDDGTTRRVARYAETGSPGLVLESRTKRVLAQEPSSPARRAGIRLPLRVPCLPVESRRRHRHRPHRHPESPPK